MPPTITRSLTDVAYARLKRRIITCDIPPGTLVSEGQLTSELGIGETPVRETLARLVQEGLVHNLPRRGYQITPITMRDVHELFALRLAVEPVAAELAAGHVDAEQLRRNDAQVRALAARDDDDSERAARYLDLNREFHAAIAEATGNRRMARLLEDLVEQCERLLRLAYLLNSRPQKLAHAHTDLVEALIAGDSASARLIVTEHIAHTHEWIVQALLSSSDLLSAPVGIPNTDVVS